MEKNYVSVYEANGNCLSQVEYNSAEAAYEAYEAKVAELEGASNNQPSVKKVLRVVRWRKWADEDKVRPMAVREVLV
jgi:hypothetical protein